jgi:hypothetical protein
VLFYKSIFSYFKGLNFKTQILFYIMQIALCAKPIKFLAKFVLSFFYCLTTLSLILENFRNWFEVVWSCFEKVTKEKRKAEKGKRTKKRVKRPRDRIRPEPENGPQPNFPLPRRGTMRPLSLSLTGWPHPLDAPPTSSQCPTQTRDVPELPDLPHP